MPAPCRKAGRWRIFFQAKHLDRPSKILPIRKDNFWGRAAVVAAFVACGIAALPTCSSSQNGLPTDEYPSAAREKRSVEINHVDFPSTLNRSEMHFDGQSDQLGADQIQITPTFLHLSGIKLVDPVTNRLTQEVKEILELDARELTRIEEGLHTIRRTIGKMRAASVLDVTDDGITIEDNADAFNAYFATASRDMLARMDERSAERAKILGLEQLICSPWMFGLKRIQQSSTDPQSIFVIYRSGPYYARAAMPADLLNELIQISK